jgi:hypothetical protein
LNTLQPNNERKNANYLNRGCEWKALNWSALSYARSHMAAIQERAWLDPFVGENIFGVS